jgi:UPF0271 protein
VSRTFDITCDMGEGYGIWAFGRDDEIVGYISSANLACGFHAGDPTIMRNTVRMAKQHGVAVGAHFGFGDLRGFGRRPIVMPPEDLINDSLYQMGALAAICRAEGIELAHVKPHGAAGLIAAEDRAMATTLVDAIAQFDETLPIYTVWNSELRNVAQEKGIATQLEVYVDRGVDDDGVELLSYDIDTIGGSVDAALDRVIGAIESGRLPSINGRPIDWEAGTVAFHSDTDDALRFAQGLNQRLVAAGYTVAPPTRA